AVDHAIITDSRGTLAQQVNCRATQIPPRSTPFPYTTLFRSRSSRTVRGATAATTAAWSHWPEPMRSPPLAASQALRNRWRLLERSEEHTSELQSRSDLVCRLLLEKKKGYAISGDLQIVLLQI